MDKDLFGGQKIRIILATVVLALSILGIFALVFGLTSTPPAKDVTTQPQEQSQTQTHEHSPSSPAQSTEPKTTNPGTSSDFNNRSTIPATGPADLLPLALVAGLLTYFAVYYLEQKVAPIKI